MLDASVSRNTTASDDPLVVWATSGPGGAVVRSWDGGDTWSDTGLGADTVRRI